MHYLDKIEETRAERLFFFGKGHRPIGPLARRGGDKEWLRES